MEESLSSAIWSPGQSRMWTLRRAAYIPPIFAVVISVGEFVRRGCSICHKYFLKNKKRPKMSLTGKEVVFTVKRRRNVVSIPDSGPRSAEVDLPRLLRSGMVMVIVMVMVMRQPGR